tara:strand:- start:25597 stop:28185 length:2589 start_codon:yes stop_codon:yes gene_type:complete
MSTLPNRRCTICTIPIAALVFALAGSVVSAQPSINARPAKVSASAQLLTPVAYRSIAQTYAWLDRDAPLLRSRITPSVVFTPTPGVMERSGYLNVQIKNRTQMLAQMAHDDLVPALSDEALEEFETVGASTTTQSAQRDLDLRYAQAQARMDQARARVEPAMRSADDDIRMLSIRIPDGVSAEVAAELLMQTGDYTFVSMDWTCFPLDTTPNDPQFTNQWYHRADRIDSVGAWDITQGSSSTIIAICDSGIDEDHPDLQAAIVSGYNAADQLAQADGGAVNDINGHGSLVAGCAAAIGNNATGVSGVGWNFGIMPIRVTNDSGGNATLSDILRGARWASDNGAYAINISFGGASDPAVGANGTHIRNEGHLLVYAAGNSGLADQVNDWQDVTIVGASTPGDNWATWSHTGIGIDCIAPGENIRSTNRNGTYTTTMGTSMAAPITAGALALVHDANPSLSADEVELTLLNACDDFQAPGQDDQTGWGRINVGRAAQDAVAGPSLIDLPFIDLFSTDTLANHWRNPMGNVDLSTAATNIPTGSFALHLDSTSSIETIAMRAGEIPSGVGEIVFFVEHFGVESFENLTLEYLNDSTAWAPLKVIPSVGTNQTEFTRHRMAIPSDGLHNGFKIRFATDGSDAGDNWYIDDLTITEFINNTLPWEDSFEDGIVLGLEWATSDATATSDASNEPDGSMSARLTNTQSMTSADVDVSPSTSALFYRFYAQHAGVETGESLLVEYKTAAGAWSTLDTIESTGSDQSEFSLYQIPFPFNAIGNTTALRFTAQGNETNDTWYIDGVAITNDLIVVETCPADLTGDGILDFFDVSDFLDAFGAQDPIADFTDDGVFDFFDVSDFLDAFGDGCP